MKIYRIDSPRFPLDQITHEADLKFNAEVSNTPTGPAHKTFSSYDDAYQWATSHIHKARISCSAIIWIDAYIGGKLFSPLLMAADKTGSTTFFHDDSEGLLVKGCPEGDFINDFIGHHDTEDRCGVLPPEGNYSWSGYPDPKSFWVGRPHTEWPVSAITPETFGLYLGRIKT